jgi:hypothetical protein
MPQPKVQRLVIAPLLLGGMILAGPFSMTETWDGLWSRLSAWLAPADYSSGIDPNGRPEGANPGSAESEYSSGIDPDGRQ